MVYAHAGRRDTGSGAPFPTAAKGHVLGVSQTGEDSQDPKDTQVDEQTNTSSRRGNLREEAVLHIYKVNVILTKKIPELFFLNLNKLVIKFI